MTAAPSRAEAVAARIRDGILRGDYRPGDRLPAERDLARELGVNRASVREALRKVEQLGLVAVRRGGGSSVRPVRDASLEVVRHLLALPGGAHRRLVPQLLDVHEMLVSGAARLAVERGDDEQLLHAGELVRRLAAPATRGAERAALVEALVDTITEASGNLVLRLCRNALRPVLAEELGALRHVLRPPAESLRTHARAIETAIARRDAVAAEEAVRALLRERRAAVGDVLNF